MAIAIATWCMAYEGIQEGQKALKNHGKAVDIVEQIAKNVEDNPGFHSVGYGGLPNKEMVVELDAGFMDGKTLGIGAVAGIHDFANPISIAKSLMDKTVNCVLVGSGAEQYASKHGFERKNMLTKPAIEKYKKETEKIQKPYQGHDTVGVSVLDDEGNLASGTTTSGLFMKEPGRVGDSPIVGSGFYADNEAGAANATGLGEDLMKGCISYEIVRRMKGGETVQDACDHTVISLHQRLIRANREAGDLSVVAIDKDGNFGAATNIEGFSFVVASDEKDAVIYLTHIEEDGKTTYTPASDEWVHEYTSRHSDGEE